MTKGTTNYSRKSDQWYIPSGIFMCSNWPRFFQSNSFMFNEEVGRLDTAEQ